MAAHLHRPDPVGEGAREALLTLANGYLATRGAAPEATADGIHYPATYVAVHHHVVLDLRRGLHLRELVVDDPISRRTRIRQERLVSLDQDLDAVASTDTHVGGLVSVDDLDSRPAEDGEPQPPRRQRVRPARSSPR